MFRTFRFNPYTPKKQTSQSSQSSQSSQVIQDNNSLKNYIPQAELDQYSLNPLFLQLIEIPIERFQYQKAAEIIGDFIKANGRENDKSSLEDAVKKRIIECFHRVMRLPKDVFVTQHQKEEEIKIHVNPLLDIFLSQFSNALRLNSKAKERQCNFNEAFRLFCRMIAIKAMLEAQNLPLPLTASQEASSKDVRRSFNALEKRAAEKLGSTNPSEIPRLIYNESRGKCTNGKMASGHFMDSRRLQARYTDKKLSPADAWKDNQTKLYIFESFFKRHLREHEKTCREGSQRRLGGKTLVIDIVGRRGCGQFSPQLTIDILQYLQCVYSPLVIRNVIDNSAGWGDRFTAFMACPQIEWILANDIADLQPIYERMRQFFKPQKKIAYLRKPLEDIQPEDLPWQKGEGPMRFDALISSPPTTQEIYGSTEGQACEVYKTPQDYMDKFLVSLVHCAQVVLKASGVVAYEIKGNGSKTNNKEFKYDYPRVLSKCFEQHPSVFSNTRMTLIEYTGFSKARYGTEGTYLVSAQYTPVMPAQLLDLLPIPEPASNSDNTDSNASVQPMIIGEKRKRDDTPESQETIAKQPRCSEKAELDHPVRFDEQIIKPDEQFRRRILIKFGLFKPELTCDQSVSPAPLAPAS
ncbi:hypothetical protein [Legionella sp. 16cNR16C]|uniref:hypothetical protein n=1 Tax=Legionella sp. 16cNR16C TaxID=2905656 RepID=UPI001E473D79|nr:hypothetical protein [Legionella sp. 16cNR16C]MCE3044201.1 hypothetical protein [Legionella sp. 16cNR16C]